MTHSHLTRREVLVVHQPDPVHEGDVGDEGEAGDEDGHEVQGIAHDLFCLSSIHSIHLQIDATSDVYCNFSPCTAFHLLLLPKC